MLLTEEGTNVIDRQLAREYSQETLSFWQEARRYRAAAPSLDDTARLTEARRLYRHYVQDGAEEQARTRRHTLRSRCPPTPHPARSRAPPH
eukprot:4267176-Prymnesium_polylepis.2